MDKTNLEALLGRPLTSKEDTNLDLYIDIAKESLENLLCISLNHEEDESDTQTYEIRCGYRTVFTDIFTEINTVKVDGVELQADEYHVAQWDKRSGTWFNSIVFEELQTAELVEIDAAWGFTTMPSDLQMLWAQLFAVVSKKYTTGSVKSKKVEDFSITYGDLTDDQVFMQANDRTIRKYRVCDMGQIRHGRVRHGHI